MTVLEVIQRSTDFLAKKGVESPRLQVELLLAHVLKLPRMRLYLDFERKLQPAELEQLRTLVQRRGTREPLQHIIGGTSFCGLEMTVSNQTLIPRPETELLAEAGWEYLKFKGQNVRAMDFGTGTGCLAVTIAVKVPFVSVVAVDISSEALEIAKVNADRYQVSDRIKFVESDGFNGIRNEQLFDLIVSNPPYIPSAEIETLEPEVRVHDPRLALDGGSDGLDFYRRLAKEAGTLLKADGVMMMEFGFGQAEEIKKLFTEQKWIVEWVKADYSNVPRIITVRRP